MYLHTLKKFLKKFMEKFNNFTPTLRFTYESISFLDLIITVSERKLKNTLHKKSTDRHKYLHYASSHPEHTKCSVVFRQTLRSREKNVYLSCEFIYV